MNSNKTASKMDRMIWNIVAAMMKNSLGEKVVHAMYGMGLAKAWIYLLYENDRKHPTANMKRSLKFCESNTIQIENACSLLADEKSRITLQKCMRFRGTHDWKDRPEYSIRNQYFPEDIVHLSDHEVFVDCGAYVGDSIKSFLKYSGGTYKKIIAFEPDEKNAEQLKKSISDVIVFNAAVWSTNTKLSFESGNGSNSQISDRMELKQIRALAIDSLAECADATFIKMDIEGSEYNALLGARNTIQNNLPILAICIYHSDEDMLRLIELIAGWNLNYNLYVRHHSQRDEETVLYAIPISEVGVVGKRRAGHKS